MKVFISSTYREFEDDRWNLLLGLRKAGFDSWGMEFFAAEAKTPKEVCLREVRESDLIILIAGETYGSVDAETGKSFTQLEYEEAKASGIDVLAFLKKSGDKDEVDKKLIAFREAVEGGGQVVDYFEGAVSLRDCVWPALFKHIRDKGDISREEKVFQGFSEFFERFLDRDKLFNHAHKLIGRESELDTLKAFLIGDDQRIVTMKGPGGVGKSKLLYEFFNRCIEETPEWEVRFLSAETEFTLESLGELPGGNVCVVVEDAHRRGREDLGRVVDGFVRSRYRARTKLILSTRASGEDMIKHVLALHDPSEVIPLRVERLDPKTHATELAKAVLGDEYVKFAEGLVRASDGNCLIICVGGMLIATERLEGALVEDENFRDMVLEKYLEEIEDGVTGASQAEVRRLLATLAGIGPVNMETKELQKMLEDDFGIGWAQLAGVFDQLESKELVLHRGRKLRAFPDVVADYVLLKASFDNHKNATGFVDELANKYGKLYFSNILRNVAEVEYSIGLKGEEPSLLSETWKGIWDFIQKASCGQIAELMDRLEPTAFFKPKEIFDICKWLLEPGNLAKAKKDEAWSKYIRLLQNSF